MNFLPCFSAGFRNAVNIGALFFCFSHNLGEYICHFEKQISNFLDLSKDIGFSSSFGYYPEKHIILHFFNKNSQKKKYQYQ